MAIAKKGSSSGFQYKSRSAEKTKERGEQSGDSREGIFQPGVQMFSPDEGDHITRPLPPTWEDAEHFGYDVYVHYNIGPDNAAYLCLQKMKGEACPICEERADAERRNESEDYVKSLKPSKRVVIYVLDRDKEKEGAKVWSMSWTIDRDLCKLSVDKRTGDLLAIDHPEEGYDIEFTREGKGLKTKYTGIQIARKSTPLDNDKALEFAVQNPIPDILVYHTYDHIAAVFTGKKEEEKEEKEPKKEETPRREPRKTREETKKEEVKEERQENPYEDITYEAIQELDDDELLDLIAHHEGLQDIDPDAANDYDTLKKEVCEALGLKKKEVAKAGGLKARLAGLKKT